MTANRIYLDYLEDLLDACRKTRQFIADMNFDQFSKKDF